jgi:uncharacterized Tic20 family protein
MESNRNTLDDITLHQEQITQDDKNLALLAHLGSLFGGFIVPLILWIVKKDESKFVSEHARKSLNFQLSMLIYVIVSFIMVFFIIGIFMMAALGVFATVVMIIASVAASKGEDYNYPLCIDFIKS